MKIKNLKKLGIIGLVCMLVLSSTGCGNKKEGVAKPQTENKETSGEVKADDGPLVPYDEPITLKVDHVSDATSKHEGNETVQDNTWVDLYNDFGIELDWIYEVDSSQAQTKLATGIASGEYPDILRLTGEELIKFAENGVIADISHLYDDYVSDHTKEYMQTDEGASLEAARYEGGLWGLPELDSPYDSLSLMFIREDWLEKLDLEIPTTMDELKVVADAFTHKDPNGSGKNDTFGFGLNGGSVFDSTGGIQAIFEGFGVIPGYFDGNFTLVEEDGELKWGGEAEGEMKEALTFLKSVYESGGLAQDFGVMTGDKILDDAGAGKAGIFFAPMWGAMGQQVDALKTDPNAKFVSAPIPGKDANTPSKPYLSNGATGYYAVSSKCENPEVLLKLFNLSVEKLCYPESAEEYLKYYGDPGKYTGFKASIVQTLEPLKNLDNYRKESVAVNKQDPEGLNAEQAADYDHIMYYLDQKDNPDLDDPKVQSGISLYTVFTSPDGSYGTIEELIERDNFQPSAYNAVQTKTMVDKYSTLNTLAKETIVKIIGGDDVDTYSKFLENWYKLGGEEVLEEANEWYKNSK